MRYGYLFHIVVTLLLVASFTANAQHTLSIEPDDTVYLEVNDWRGQIQWQLSHDQINWSDIPGRTYDTMKYVRNNSLHTSERRLPMVNVIHIIQRRSKFWR